MNTKTSVPAKTKTCALVGASNFNAKHFTQHYESGAFDLVIAVDAGFSHLENLGISPDIALGDFDSLGYVPATSNVMRFPAQKDASDMELAAQKALDIGCKAFFVYGALGKRLDHSLGNILMFAGISEKGAEITLFDEDQALRLLTGPACFELPKNLDGGIVSVFSLSECSKGVTECGLAYEIEDETLISHTTLGLSNELYAQPSSHLGSQPNPQPTTHTTAQPTSHPASYATAQPTSHPASVSPSIEVKEGTLAVFFPLV